MNWLDVLQNAPLVDSFGWTLVHFVWQGFLIALVLRISLQFVGSRDASKRYLLATAAMLMLTAAPVVTFLMVHDTGPEASSFETANRALEAPAPGKADAAVSSGVAGAATLRADTWTGLAAFQERLTSYLQSALPWIVIGWMMGVIMLSARLLLGNIYTYRLRTRGVAPVNEALHKRFESLRETIGVTRSVELLKSAVVQVPSVVGFLKPVVLIPASALSGLTPAQLEAVLAHELAHVKRHDHLVNVLQSITEAVLFYHPAVWWVSDQIRAERENCCDDAAVTACGSLRTYVHALTNLEEQRSNRPALALAASDGSLLSRVKRLLDLSSNADEADRQSWISGLAVFAIVAVVLTGSGTSYSAAPAAESSWMTGVESFRALQLAPTEEASPRVAAEEEAKTSPADDPVVQALIAALDGADASMRAEIAHALGQRESAEAIDALAGLLDTDESAEVRKLAAWALGMIEDARGVPALERSLSKPSEAEEVKAQAVWALGMIEDEAAVDRLVELLDDPSSDVRSDVAWALGMIESGEAASPLVSRLGQEQDRDVQKQIVWALGMIEDEAAVDGLVPMLDAADAEMRKQTAWALGMIESSRAVEPLIRRFEAEEVIAVKIGLAHALGMIEDDRAADVLAGALHSDDPDLRRAAISALAMMSGPNPNPNPNPNPHPNPSPNPNPNP